MEQEGVIKFSLIFRGGPPLLRHQVAEVNAWRQKLFQARLIGQDAALYGGAGYGNISQRIGPLNRPPHRRRFVISGTQTGAMPVLDKRHFAIVDACFPSQNRVVAGGPVRPSSESMTHGMIYAMDNALRFVFHVHSPQIWQHAHLLDLPTTRETVAYGTPEMAEEVVRLFRETDVHARRIFAMGGHEDGLIAFGCTAEEAAHALHHAHIRACQEAACAVVF